MRNIIDGMAILTLVIFVFNLSGVIEFYENSIYATTWMVIQFFGLAWIWIECDE